MRIIIDIKAPEGLTQEQQDSFLSNLWAGMRKTGFTEYMRRSKTMWSQASDVLRNYELINDEQYRKLTEGITISKSEYDRLIHNSEKLEALEQGGVDNWQGYGDALDKYSSEDDNE